MNIAVNKMLLSTADGGNSTTNTNPSTPFKEIIDFYCELHMTDINVLRGKMPSFCDVAAFFAISIHTIPPRTRRE